MVRHHVNKSKKKTSPKDKNDFKRKEELLKDLDRFAGSSEEDDDDVDDESTNQDLPQNTKARNKSKNPNLGTIHANGDDADASSNGEHEDDSSSDEDEYGISSLNSSIVRGDDLEKEGEHQFAITKSSESDGMAGAMAKILGLNPPKSSSSVILSKTTTPLQKLQQKEKAEKAALKAKQRIRREVNLIAMHVPLSAATSKSLGKRASTGTNGLRLAKEIETESMHRRVATRGVVALFNTIAKHQQEKAQQVRQLVRTF